ncbi:MAG: response regulator [Planctomycetota bacterium]|nr:MAG: response regulator [Planctomycetota bacterium]
MSGVRVLYLEDDPFDVELVVETLTAEGIELDLTVVDVPDDYLQALHARRYDLILVDYSLPGYDGKAALRAAVEAQPDVPVILISGAIGEDLAIDAVKSGATDYVLKQRISRLGPAVRRALQEAEEARRRTAAERSLSEISARLRGFMDGAPDAFFIFDKDFRLIDVNAAVVACMVPDQDPQRLLGMSLDEIVGDMLEPDDVHRLKEVVETGRVAILLRRRYRWGDREGWMDIRGFRAGSGLGLVVSERTEHYQLLEEREDLISELELKNSELERFVYTVSHDLKSPLVTIKGFLDLLPEDVAEGNMEAFHDDLGRIRRAADTMDRLLDDLLHLSRIGRVVGRIEVIDTRKVVDEVLEILHAQVFANGITVSVAEHLPSIKGDRRRIVELFQNLIENACKHMGKVDSPRIEIGAEESEGETVFFVRDNGEGIPPEHQEKIFELFRCLKTDSGGSGIGLALVRRIIETHGGRIWVESEGRGHGATFRFTLPVVYEGATETSSNR